MRQRADEHEKLLILDFGSQYTQLIARRVRELGVYCEVKPYHNTIPVGGNWKAVILSGSPCSVHDQKAPKVDLDTILAKYPVLGICYGAQLLASYYGGRVVRSQKREYGRASLQTLQNNLLLEGIHKGVDVCKYSRHTCGCLSGTG